MNALTVETGFKVAAAEHYAPLPGECGTSGAVIEGEQAIVVFLCREMKHKGSNLWLALVQIDVDAPALVQQPGDSYSTAYNSLLAWLTEPAEGQTEREHKDAVASAFVGSGIRLNGFHVQTSGQGMQDNRWVASISLIAGVSKEPAS